MLLFDSDNVFVELDEDRLRICLRSELTGEEFRILHKVVSFALSVYTQKKGGSSWGRTNFNDSCSYFFVKCGTVSGLIFLVRNLKELTFDLQTGRVVSKPNYLARASELLTSSGFGAGSLPGINEIKDGRIEFVEEVYGYGGWKIYKAILHIDRAELEYRIEGDRPTRPRSKLFVVRDVNKGGERYILFKGALHPFGDRVYYNLVRGEIRYENDYCNKVAEFWKRVRESGVKILGEKVQLKVMDMLKFKSVEEVLKWYRGRINGLEARLKNNEKVEKKYVELATKCHLEVGDCLLVVLPTNYKYLVFIHGDECSVVKTDKKDWIKRKRELKMILYRLLENKVHEAIVVAGRVGRKLDDGEAGEILAKEIDKLRKNQYTTYLLIRGKLCVGWRPETKKLADILLSQLPMKMRGRILASLV